MKKCNGRCGIWAPGGFAVLHEFRLEGPGIHEHFDARDGGWTKAVLRPNRHGSGHER